MLRVRSQRSVRRRIAIARRKPLLARRGCGSRSARSGAAREQRRHRFACRIWAHRRRQSPKRSVRRKPDSKAGEARGARPRPKRPTRAALSLKRRAPRLEVAPTRRAPTLVGLPKAALLRRRPTPRLPRKATAPLVDKTQLLVLGAGPGGYTAAFRAADLGLQVTLVERWPSLGGVCLNVGCIPSKALLHAAKVIDEAQRDGRARHRASASRRSISASCATGRTSVVKKLTGGLKMLAKQRKVEVVHGHRQIRRRRTSSK